MSTIEKLFVQIFDRKRQIGEQLNHQKQLYEQHLASKLLIQGITPPPWLLRSDGFASSTSSSNPRDLNKEDLIHDLLLPRPKPPASYPNDSHLYAKLFPTATRDELQYDLFNASSALCKGSDDSRAGVLPQCLFKGQEGTHDHVAESPLDRAVPDNDAGLDQSLARIQRSRSRQKALEIRSSRKLSSKRRLEDNPPTVTAEQEPPTQRIAAVDRNSSPAHTSLVKEDTSCREVEAFRHSIRQMDAVTHCRSSPSDCHKLSIVESPVAPDSDPRSGREFSEPVAHEPDVERHSEDNLPTVTAEQELPIQGIAAVDRNLCPAQMSLVKEDTSCREVEAFSHSIKQMDASTHCRSSPIDCHRLPVVESLVAPDSDPRSEREFSKPVAHETDVERRLEDNPPTVTAEQEPPTQRIAAVDRNLCPVQMSLVKEDTPCREVEAFSHSIKQMDASTHRRSSPIDCHRLPVVESLVAPDSDPRSEREFSKPVAHEPDVERHSEDNLPTVTAGQDMLIQRSEDADRNFCSTAHNSLAKKRKTSSKEAEAFRHTIKKNDASTICLSPPSNCQDLSVEKSAVAPDGVPRKEREFSKRVAEQDLLIRGSAAVDRNLSSTTPNSLAKKQKTSCEEPEAFRHTIMKMGASTICLSTPSDCQDLSIKKFAVAPDSVPNKEREILKRSADEPDAMCPLKDSPSLTAEQDMLIQGSGAVDRNSNPLTHKYVAEEQNTSRKGAGPFRHATEEMGASTICRSLPGDCQNSSMEESLVASNSAPSRKWEIFQRFDNAPEFKCLLEDNLPTENAEQDFLMQGIGVVDRNSSPPTRKSIAQKQDTSCYGADAYRHTIKEMDASTICQLRPGDCQNSSMEVSRVAPDSAPGKEWEISQCLANEPEVKRLLESLPTETAEKDVLIQGSGAVDRNSSPPAQKFITEMQDTSCNGVDGFRHTFREMDSSTICRSLPGDCLDLSMEESLVVQDSAPSREREISKCFAYESEVKRLFEDNLSIETGEQETLIQGSAAADRNMSLPTHTTRQMDASTTCWSLTSDCQNFSMEESLVAPDCVPSNEREISQSFADEPSAVIDVSRDVKSPKYSPSTEELSENQGLCCDEEEISGSRSNTAIEMGGTYIVKKEDSSYDPCSLSLAGQTVIVNGPSESCVCDGVKSFQSNKILESSSVQVTRDASLESPPLRADDFPSDGVNFSGEFNGPCVSPVRKTFDGVAARSGVSSSQGICSPELAFFLVDEGGGEDSLDDSDHICPEETGSLRDSLLCFSKDNKKGVDSALDIAGLGSHPIDYQSFSVEESLAIPDSVFSSQREVSESFADEPDTMIDVACDGKSPKYNPIIEELIENQGLHFKEEEISRSCPGESDTSIGMGAAYVVQKEESSYDPCSLLSAGQTVAVNEPSESCVGDDFKSFETNKILGSSFFQVTQDGSLGSQPLGADDLPSVGARFSWELKVPCVSPGRKSIDGLTARSGGSSSRGSQNPEFACFPIDECGEEDDDDAYNADHICSEETGLLRDSLHCLSEDKEKGTDSALNTAGLGSHCTEVGLSDSDRQSNAELDCLPAGRGSEQDVHGVEALKTCQEEAGCIRKPLYNISNSMVLAIGSLSNKASESFCRSSGTSELNDKTTQKSQNRRNGRLSQQKQSHNFSLGTSCVKKRSDSLKTRHSKPKASAKTSMEIRSVGTSEKEPMRKNIVSNMSSFLPLIQQKQAAARAPVKKEVKVKALEAAEAAKRLAEKKENERKHKKEALKLERARMEQENLRRLELVKKAKEAEKKKKDAEVAARKRQREEDERKEKERKKKRVGEARTQQKGNVVQMSVDKAECKIRAEDGKTNRRNEGNAVTGKTMDVEQDDERAGTSLANNLAVSSSDKASDSNTASCSTPKPDQNNSSASQEIREKSYEISPYCCSDGEDEEEDDLSNKKFMPSWASKSNLRLALSSSNALSPSFVFPLKSFCSLSEVLLPRELQRR